MQVADKEGKMEKFGRYSSQSLWYSKMLTFFSCVPCKTEMKQSIMTDNNQVAAVTRIRESYYFKSFQGTHSIVLMAVAGSQYLFCFNVGTLWRLLVMGKFSKTAPLANNCMRASSLCLGQLCNQGERVCPHVFVGDEAFQLCPDFMQPLPDTQTEAEVIFNYRLSCTRSVPHQVKTVIVHPPSMLLRLFPPSFCYCNLVPACISLFLLHIIC